MAAPKLGGAVVAAEGAVPPPKAKPVEAEPNVGLAGVPKVVAVVAPVEPKVNGAGAAAGAGLGAGVDDAVLFPKANVFCDAAAAAAEPNADAVAGVSNAGFPKANVDCVVVAAAVEAEPAMAKPPNEAVVVLAAGAVWPKANTF